MTCSSFNLSPFSDQLQTDFISFTDKGWGEKQTQIFSDFSGSPIKPFEQTQQSVLTNRMNTPKDYTDDITAVSVTDLSEKAKDKAPTLIINGMNSSFPDASALVKDLAEKDLTSKAVIVDLLGNGANGLHQTENNTFTASSLADYSQQEYHDKNANAIKESIKAGLQDQNRLNIFSQSASAVPTLKAAIEEIINAPEGKIPQINLMMVDPFLGLSGTEKLIVQNSENLKMAGPAFGLLGGGIGGLITHNFANNFIQSKVPPKEFETIDRSNTETFNQHLSTIYESSDEKKFSQDKNGFNDKEYPKDKAYDYLAGLDNQSENIGSKAVTRGIILEGEKRFDELISFITQLTDEQKARLKTHLQVEVLQADTGSKTDKGKLKSLKSAFNSAFNNENIFQTSVIPKMMHNGYLTNPSALINEFKKNQFPTRQKIEPEGLD